MTTATPTLVVRSASIVALRLFDVAYAIDLTRVEGLWSSHSRASLSRGRLAYTPSMALACDVLPVSLTLEFVRVQIGSDTRTATLSARVCDFGVVSIRGPHRAHIACSHAFGSTLSGRFHALRATTLFVVDIPFDDAIDDVPTRRPGTMTAPPPMPTLPSVQLEEKTMAQQNERNRNPKQQGQQNAPNRDRPQQGSGRPQGGGRDQDDIRRQQAQDQTRGGQMGEGQQGAGQPERESDPKGGRQMQDKQD